MTDDDLPSELLLPLIIAVAVLILLSMCFSASEAAFLSVNKLRIRFLRSRKDKKAERVGKLLEKKEALLNTLLIGNNIVNITVSSILTSLALAFFGSSGVGIATIAATVVLLIFGEITPKTIAVSRPEPTAFLFVPLISLFVRVFSPVVRIFTFISTAIARLFGIKPAEKQVSFTEEDIKTMIDVGEEEGVLESGEKDMLHQVFKFTDLSAREIMIPRTAISAVSLDAGWDEVLELSRSSLFSRFPVYGRDIDDIKGIFYIKDFLFYEGTPEDFSVKKLLRPPLFILENRTIFSIERQFRESDYNMAIVVDEYSGTAGIITMEDLAQEIFGGIGDEYDDPEHNPIHKISEDERIIPGTTRLVDLSDELGITLDSEFYDTIAGYISERTGEVPVAGAYIDEGDFRFTAEEVTDRSIVSVRVSRSGERRSDERNREPEDAP
ncbi:MAG: hemolysin family protein [Spirochaetaceae bacterium]|jgi:CBS domain containing-hemolysin-like protein|nr:hemolysin family protein [Spirochaetaceae bacterium]